MSRNLLRIAIWLVFVVHGICYCNLIPLWEGFDEWGHYAVVERLRLHPGMPRTTDRVTEEIRQSVQSARIRHEASDPMMVFEAQQPPLYYWILSVPNGWWIGADISTRVHRLRIFSVLIASLAILFAFELFHSRRMAFSVCALIAVMPGLMIDIARIGNESLSIALCSWLILLVGRTPRSAADPLVGLLARRQKATIALGLALGMGLLTKAYFLAFIPLLILRKRFLSLAIGIAIGGWWYWRNFRLTGTWTGEIMDVATAGLGWHAKLAAARNMHWLTVLDSAVWTHIWTGAWSFFTLRSWMYRVFELIFAIAAIMVVYGLARRPWGRFKGKFAMLISLEALFAVGIAYQSIAIFQAKNIYFAPGWYFYALVVAEAVLLASGLLILVGRRRVLWAIGFLVALFAAMDVYSAIFILAKHYKY